MKSHPFEMKTKIWRYWFIAQGFLTCVPVPKFNYQNRDLSRAAVFFPVIGGLIGVFNYGLYFLLRFMNAGNWLIALILVSSSIVLTRGLHLDGWADVCDALFSTHNVQRRREILKDSRLGTFGVVGIFLLLCFKTIALSERLMPIFLILSPMAGRTAALIVGGLFRPYQQEKKSLGEEFIGQIPWQIVGIWLGILILFPLFWIGDYYPLKAALVFFIGWLFSKMMEKSFQGLSGDAVGAVVELVETLFLFLGRK
ncbi:MAG: adenosylcobinamide-GDP ribazoletransferase [Candidatus Atribacteria bacterium]|nr:adenosylcobinamide-GDP ribazoletransferase [Candidatus Atribacteria bacterium]